MRRILISFVFLIVLLALAVAGWQLSKSRTFQFYGGLITQGEGTDRVVALTLDDGPSTRWTPAVLSMLDSLDVKATFFVTGNELEKNAAQGRDIVAAGHALGNHSYSHRQMVLHSPSFVRDEVERTDSLIRAAGWEGEIFFRPPYGKRLIVLPRYLHQTRRKTLLWDIEPESNSTVARTAEGIADHVVEEVVPGSIVLLHVMYDSRAESRRALPIIVNRLRNAGYRFVTIPELLSGSDN